MTILFSMTFTFPSYGEWEKIIKMGDYLSSGNDYYVDFKSIRKVKGYIYYWILIDYLEPNLDGDLSVKVYHQGDCKLTRLKKLSFISYGERMGKGTSKWSHPQSFFRKWWATTPSWKKGTNPKHNLDGYLLQTYCNHIK